MLHHNRELQCGQRRRLRSGGACSLPDDRSSTVASGRDIDNGTTCIIAAPVWTHAARDNGPDAGSNRADDRSFRRDGPSRTPNDPRADHARTMRVSNGCCNDVAGAGITADAGIGDVDARSTVMDFHINHSNEANMRRNDRSTLESFQRVQEFLTQHPQPDAVGVLAAQSADLADVIAKLAAQYEEQDGGTRATDARTKSRRALRSTLWARNMAPIARVARELLGPTGIDRALRLPRSGSVSDVAMVTAVNAMATAVEPHVDAFVKRGFPVAFVAQLRGAAQALADGRTAIAESNRQRVTATAAAKVRLRRGRSVVREIKAILEPRLASDPDLLAAWRSARSLRIASPAEVQPPAPAATPVIKAA